MITDFKLILSTGYITNKPITNPLSDNIKIK